MTKESIINESKYPARRHPAHPVPIERGNHPVVLMITVGLRKPNAYHCFDNQMFQAALLNAWLRAPEWQVGNYIIMPDHLHLFCISARLERYSVSAWCRKWKSLVAMSLSQADWRWLPGCWDTQMRGLDHYVEKRAYVEMNPVRKQLVKTPELWPYKGEVSPIIW